MGRKTGTPHSSSSPACVPGPSVGQEDQIMAGAECRQLWGRRGWSRLPPRAGHLERRHSLPDLRDSRHVTARNASSMARAYRTSWRS